MGSLRRLLGIGVLGFALGTSASAQSLSSSVRHASMSRENVQEDVEPHLSDIITVADGLDVDKGTRYFIHRFFGDFDLKIEAEDIEETLVNMNLPAPDVWDIDYEDFLEAFKMSLLLRDWISELGEDKLLDKYGIAPGELYNKMTNAEWLLYSASELAMLLNKWDAATNLNKLRFRLKHGIREELLKLVKIKGIGRVRARMLYKNGIKDTLKLRKASDARLENLLGKKITAEIRRHMQESLDRKMRYVKRGKYE